MLEHGRLKSEGWLINSGLGIEMDNDKVIVTTETVHYRLQSLEAAISYAIASISLQMPAVKSDVVDALRRDAANNIDLVAAQKALNELADQIDKIKVYPKSSPHH